MGCPEYFPWCQALVEPAYRATLTAHSTEGLALEVSLEALTLTPITMDGQSYTALALPSALGVPATPEVGLLLGLPAGVSGATVAGVEVLESETLEAIDVVPTQPPHREGAPSAAAPKDTARYAQDELWPSTLAEVQAPTLWRSHRVVRLIARPVQVNPVARQVKIHRRLRISVRFAWSRDGASLPSAGAQAEAMAQTLLNYEQLAAETRDEAPRFLVVVDEALIAASAPLVEAREAEGFQVKQLTTKAISAEALKAQLVAQYRTFPFEYLLLIGDPEVLPLGGWADLPSDLWYGCLSGEDPFPEAYVGRLSVSTPEEASRQVDRLLKHQRQEDTAWRHRALLISHEEGYPNQYAGCIEQISKAYASALSLRVLHGANGATNEAVVAAINEGVGLVNYRGHGHETGWSWWNGREDLEVEHLPLTNEAHLPVVLSIACLNLAMDGEAPSHGEQWLSHIGGGAIAFLGATRPSYTAPNHDFNRYLFEALLDNGEERLGPLLAQANARLLAQYGQDSFAVENVWMYAWLGDPSMRVGLSEPVRESGLVLNEVMLTPVSDHNGDGSLEPGEDEFIELVNGGRTPLALGGWVLSDRTGPRFVFPAVTIAPGRALLVFGGGAPQGDFGGAQVLAGSGRLGLNDEGGDEVRLNDQAGGLRLRATLGPSAGRSLTRAVDGDAAARFIPHPGTRGASPGTRQDGAAFGGLAPARPLVIINEVLSHPTEDANGDGVVSESADEFIELVNAGPQAVGLEGYTLSDARGFKVKLPALTLAPGKAVVVFSAGGLPMGAFGGAAVVRSPRSLSLNDEGDQVRLGAADGAVVDMVTFGASALRGTSRPSFTRAPDGVPGAPMVPHPDRPFSPGTRVDLSSW